MIDDFLPVNSTSGNIQGVRYDPARQVMTVRFALGTTYEYDNVDQDKFDGFAATFADDKVSTGNYFHREFRTQADKHPFRRLAETVKEERDGQAG